MLVEQDSPMGVGHLTAADFDYHLQDDMAALASQINTTATADTLEGLSAEHWASAVQEATRLPPFRDGAHAAGVAASRWFKNDEVHDLLVNGLAHHGFQIEASLACKPVSGSLLFFSKQTCRNFRTDSHQWRTKKNGKSLQETHEKLKVHGEYKLVAYYSTTADATLQRRVYRQPPILGLTSALGVAPTLAAAPTLAVAPALARAPAPDPALALTGIAPPRVQSDRRQGPRARALPHTQHPAPATAAARRQHDGRLCSQ